MKMRYVNSFKIMSLLLLTMTLLQGCGLLRDLLGLGPVYDNISDITERINEAVEDLSNLPGNANSILEGLITDLEDIAAKSTSDLESIAEDALNEVETISQYLTASINIGINCSIDFMGKRVKLSLQELIAELENSPPPQRIPAVCLPAPATLKAHNPEVIRFTGYDFKEFDEQNYSAVIEYQDGQIAVNSLGRLSFPSNYEIQLNISQNELVGLAGSRKPRVVLKWNNGDIEGNSSISIIMPPSPTVILTQDPTNNEIEKGKSVTLSWTSENADYCQASGDWTGRLNPDGARDVAIDKVGQNRYTITCYGFSGEVSQESIITGTIPTPSRCVNDRSVPIVASNITNNSVLFNKLEETIPLWLVNTMKIQINQYLDQGTPCIVIFKDTGFRGDYRIIPSYQNNRLNSITNIEGYDNFNNEPKSFMFFDLPRNDGKRVVFKYWADQNFTDDYISVCGPFSHSELSKLKDFCSKCPGELESLSFELK